MPTEYFRFLKVSEGKPLELGDPLTLPHLDPEHYEPAEGLAQAIESAALLGMPLLLTGEPGMGKTQASRWLAHMLRARYLRHNVKSDTTGRELLYVFDEVGRFREASRGIERPLIEYITFSALGEAIVRGIGGASELLSCRPGQPIPENAFGKDARLSTASLLPRDPSFAGAKPEHCVVLIDELDKAPRDTPNDLLAEFENLSFEIPELGVRVDAEKKRRPIVLITSNSERTLPPPFLRRCLFFDIPAPNEKTMMEIVGKILGTRNLDGDTPLFKDAWRLYNWIRDDQRMGKKPGTAEFLTWLDLLMAQGGLTPADRLAGKAGDPNVRATLRSLGKSSEDQTIVFALLGRPDDDWA